MQDPVDTVLYTDISFIVLSIVAWLASDLIVTNCDESEEKRARRLV